MTTVKGLRICLLLAALVAGGGGSVYQMLHEAQESRPDCDYSLSEEDRHYRQMFNDIAGIERPKVSCQLHNYLATSVREHPVASVVGAAAPFIVLAPLAWWLFGFPARRVHAQLTSDAGRAQVQAIRDGYARVREKIRRALKIPSAGWAFFWLAAALIVWHILTTGLLIGSEVKQRQLSYGSAFVHSCKYLYLSGVQEFTYPPVVIETRWEAEHQFCPPTPPSVSLRADSVE